MNGTVLPTLRAERWQLQTILNSGRFSVPFSPR